VTERQDVNAATDDQGVIRIVETAEYEARKGPGIAAPWPDEEAVFVHPWPDSTRVLWRASDDDEWSELKWLDPGTSFRAFPGSSLKVISPPGLHFGGMSVKA
jgi:hypothetical protein